MDVWMWHQCYWGISTTRISLEERLRLIYPWLKLRMRLWDSHLLVKGTRFLLRCSTGQNTVDKIKVFLTNLFENCMVGEADLMQNVEENLNRFENPVWVNYNKGFKDGKRRPIGGLWLLPSLGIWLRLLLLCTESSACTFRCKFKAPNTSEHISG